LTGLHYTNISMTSEERKAALEKEYSIVQATIDYLIGLHGRTIVYDGDDVIGHYYRQEKQKAEKLYQEHKRSRLQLQLKKITKSLESSMDFNYPVFIKEQTGYFIDLFEQFKKNIDHFISQEAIHTKEEWTEALKLLEYSKRTQADTTTIEKLNRLIQHYTEKHIAELTRKKKNERTEEISRSLVTEHIEVVKVRISTGPKPKHEKEWEILSPDKKLKLRIIQLAFGDSASTSVNINFPKTEGTAYCIKGIHDIEAYWKDNSTIAIYTTPDHQQIVAYKKVESFSDSIHIEYLNTEAPSSLNNSA
jgi:hypothetical protein